MEITSFFSACGSNKFHGQKNKLSRSMTRIIADFGQNFHSFCKNVKILSESRKNIHKYNLIIKSMNEHRQSAFPDKQR